MKIAVLQTSYKRIRDTKIGMRIIREVWPQVPTLQNVDIYHANNAPDHEYPQKYLENFLIRRPTMTHYEGAADLIDAGVNAILQHEEKYDFILVMSGDVWLVKPQEIENILLKMHSKNVSFASSLWPNLLFMPTLFSTEFFIITPNLARNVFPLNLHSFFSRRHVANFLYSLTLRVPVLTLPKVEVCFTEKVKNAVQKDQSSWMLIPGRRVNIGVNRFYSPKLGYLSHHDLNEKIALAQKFTSMKLEKE